MIPLRADPRLFDCYDPEAETDGIYGNASSTLEFELKVKCKRNPDAPKESEDPDDLYIDHKVFTKHIKWIPRKGQIQMLSGKTGLILYILRPNGRLFLDTCHAVDFSEKLSFGLLEFYPE